MTSTANRLGRFIAISMSLASQAWPVWSAPPLTLEATAPRDAATPQAVAPNATPPVVAVGGVSLPWVPAAVAQAAVEAGNAARRAQDGTPDSPEDALGAEAGAGSSTLTVTPGSTELVRVARNYLNQIVTPFRSPKLLTVNAVEVKQEGASLYVATSSSAPVGVHIRSNDPADTRSISLTLIPARIPPRTITLQWPGSVGPADAPASTADAQRWEESAPYESQLLNLVQRVALGGVPDGYSLTEAHEQLNCSLPGVKFFTGQRLTGHHFSVFVVKATNESANTLELRSHAGCGVPGVRLVAPWPVAYLEPNASTELYVVVSNDAAGEARALVRPSLLGKGGQP